MVMELFFFWDGRCGLLVGIVAQTVEEGHSSQTVCLQDSPSRAEESFRTIRRCRTHALSSRGRGAEMGENHLL